MLGEDASPLGLGPAARPAMGLGAVGAQHDASALMAGDAVPSGQGASVGHELLLLGIDFLIHSNPSSCVAPRHTAVRKALKGETSVARRPVELTVGIVRVLHPGHCAAPEHHLVFRQRARLIREDVLHLAQILGDIKRPALQLGVRLLVVQIHVLMDEVHLADLHNFNRHEERDGYQHLGEERKVTERIQSTKCTSDQTA